MSRHLGVLQDLIRGPSVSGQETPESEPRPAEPGPAMTHLWHAFLLLVSPVPERFEKHCLKQSERVQVQALLAARALRVRLHRSSIGRLPPAPGDGTPGSASAGCDAVPVPPG